ncbi:hypothetical protein MHSWG343_04620 [Candidatus Mycoplasma haematohominis]|uniref:Uncharacterized protein n=1 Tax=Candidatus Mycoplasma haematohominis TaxID=1494318 RepID=A0A478FTN9_9MOLU|nr:hypothetical protein MHSWG343_04620 [Candidatus Mycoplasma haemohominis]
MNAAQVAGALGAGTLLAGGSYLGYSYLSVSYTTLENSNATSYGNGTIGNNNKSQLVDPFFEDNEKWWNSVHKVLVGDKTNKESEISDEFKKVTKGFKNNKEENGTHLNQICNVAFKKQENETYNSKYLKNVWTYCSINGNLAEEKGNEPKPKSLLEIADSNVSASHIGGIAQNKDKLAANHADNQYWWNWVYENRFQPAKPSTGSGNLSTEFSSVDKGYNATDNKALSKVCADQYKKETSNFSSDSNQSADNKYKLKKDVERFCTFKGSETLDLSAQ